MNESPTLASYDDTPYDSLPFAQTHPAHLAAVATLFELNPSPVESCRVLELGCSSGGNLVPMAESLPGSSFVGVDLSARQIADGERVLRKTGLRNVTLRHASIADVDASYGEFDYIVCHGVFSWVPREVQEKIFDVCTRRLTPHGIALVSYNTYPGWHMRAVVRDMMQYRARRFDAPSERIAHSRALLQRLAETTRDDPGPFGALLRAELAYMNTQSDYYLYHEQLKDVNEPVYFHAFVDRAIAHGLRYLGESRITNMVTGNLDAKVQSVLAELAAEPIEAEQYLNFVRNRMFRETLLVRAERVPNWTIAAERLFSLHLSVCATVEGDRTDLAREAPLRFQSRSGTVVTATGPLFKSVMLALTEAWPGSLSFAEVVHRAVTKLEREAVADDLTALSAGLLNVYVSADLVELSTIPVVVARTASERPVALLHARVNAAEGRTKVANRRHEQVQLSDLHRHLLPLLDGTHDRNALVDALVRRALAGEITIGKARHTLTTRAELHATLTTAVETALDALARESLLVG